jgi:hypothetical protein
MPSNQTDNPKPPYVSWVTFTNFLDEKVNDETLPTELDKSWLDTYSGSNQAMILSTLKFFELIDDDNRVLRKLKEVANSTEARRHHFKYVLEKRYAPLVEHGRQKATAQKMHEWFGEEFDFKGSTLTKAEGFYIAAAEYAGVTLSPNFKPKASSKSAGNGARGRRSRQATASASPAFTPLPAVATKTGASSVEVDFGPAGQVTLSVNVDWLGLSDVAFTELRKLIKDLESLAAKEAVVADEDIEWESDE